MALGRLHCHTRQPAAAEAVSGHPLSGQGPAGRWGRGAGPYQLHEGLRQPVIKPPGAGNQPPLESLYHGTPQTLQIGAFAFWGAGFPAHPSGGHTQTGSFGVLGTTEEAVDMGVGTVPTLCRISSISEGVNGEQRQGAPATSSKRLPSTGEVAERGV